ncbi:hypothetical protein [Streptomyces venezuelae]|uniref:hypothetical protein n=1 Tax=Streptomyces venezuelae TaxID=54571 RepID=UPI003421A54D
MSEQASKTEEPLSTWLEGHHRIEPASAKTNDTELHIYAQTVGGDPVFGGAAKYMADADVAVSLQGALTLELHIEQDREGNLTCRLGCAVPFHSPVLLGEAKGSPAAGVPISFQSDIVRGRATVYHKDGWCWLHIDGAVLGKHLNIDTKLYRFL